jgi:hypothetical protein
MPLIESGQLKMAGRISPELLKSIRIERFHAAVEDWFRNKSRTFNAKNYNKYQKAHDKWEGEDSTRILEHQFRHRDAECTCGPELPEPKKSDYFPSEPSARSLSKVLASVSRVRHIAFAVVLDIGICKVRPILQNLVTENEFSVLNRSNV